MGLGPKSALGYFVGGAEVSPAWTAPPSEALPGLGMVCSLDPALSTRAGVGRRD